MSLIEFTNVNVSYDGKPVLSDVTLSMTESRIGIIGANGGGKSTLVRLINGLGEPQSGTVTVDGIDVSKNGAAVRRKVGFVFSDAENQIVMPVVRDDVAFSLRRMGFSRSERIERAEAALSRFGLLEHAERSPHTLSGGQKQLLALASVLVMEPEILIADEPTTLLDLRNRDRIKREFGRLDQQLIVVTHDLEFLEDFDRVICIDDHRITADGSPREVIEFYRRIMAEKPL